MTGSLSRKLPQECQLPSTLKFGTESQWQLRWGQFPVCQQEYEGRPQSRGTWNCIASKEGTLGSHEPQSVYKDLVWTRDAVSARLAWSLVGEPHACPQVYVKQEKGWVVNTQRIPRWHSQQGAQVPLSQHFLYDLRNVFMYSKKIYTS